MNRQAVISLPRGPSLGRARGARASARGMTLLELLVVMVVLGMMLGLGLGALSSLDLGRRQAVGALKNVLRTAQNTAVSRGIEARVRLDPAAGVVRAEALRVIGTWEFEDPELSGAFGLGGILRGAEVDPDGFLGSALRFPAEVGGARAEFDVEQDASFDLRDGFSVAFVLRRDEEGAVSLVDVGGACGIQLLPRGALRGWLAPRMEGGGAARKGPPVVCETAEGVIPLAVWTRVELAYDREVLALAVDGARSAAVEETAAVFAVEDRLVAGDRQRRFSGALDSLVISAVESGEELHLPEGVALEAGAPLEIRFDASGHLDRRRHAGPVRIGLLRDGALDLRLVVGRYGTVEEEG